MAVYREQPTLPSPVWQSSLSAWLRKNLFSSWLNGLVTIALRLKTKYFPYEQRTLTGVCHVHLQPKR